MRTYAHILNSSGHVQMIDFGLADFREVFGAGYVSGKRNKLIHNEPHHVQPLRHENSRGPRTGQQPTGEQQSDQAEHRRVPIRGNKGIDKRSDAVPESRKGIRVSKFFPTPAGLIPQVSFSARMSCTLYTCTSYLRDCHAYLRSVSRY